MSQPAHSRQRPVSCRFCRTRKLRCDRAVPCSSCVSRGINCDLRLPLSSASRTGDATDSDLIERVRRLEEIIQSQRSQLESATKLQSAQAKDAPLATPDVVGLSLQTHRHQTDGAPLDQTQINRLDSDVALLESIYSGDGASVNPFPLRCEGKYAVPGNINLASSKIVFKVCPIQQIMDAPPYTNQSGSAGSNGFGLLRCIWLPQHSEARVLLDKYIQDIDHFHHIVHIPSLPTLVDNFYDSFHKQGHVNPGVVILLLGIFGTTTHSWVHEDAKRGLFSDPAEAHRQLTMWTQSVEDVLDIAHRCSAIPIEGVQGTIIAFWVVFNRDGFTRRGWSLWNMALLLARQLNLHFLDHPSNSALASAPETEIQRRVWWYIVASDWAASSRFAGSYSGVYQCHVRQMIVKKPMNLNDADLVDGMALAEKPLSQPTDMSYSIFRIRLAEISRHITDRTPIVMAQSTILKHEVVMDIDVEMQLLLNEIPPFFSMSISDLVKTYNLDEARAESISFQGHMFSTLFYSQRCVLHFPYYSRGFVDPAFASSREICFESARLTVQTEMKFRELPLHRRSRFNYLGIFVAVFMASIVFFMHSCHNKNTSNDEVQFKELNDAIILLDEARNESQTASKFLDLLMRMVREHLASSIHRRVPSQASKTSTSPNLAMDEKEIQDINPSRDVSMETLRRDFVGAETEFGSSDENLGGEDLSSYFTELAQNFEYGMDFSSFDWETVFSNIDSSFI